MLRFLFITLACLALVGCKTAGDAPAENKTGEAERSIYYKSQAAADTALAAFDKDNPSCQLWTNWQKMCSRTGEGGISTYCVTDSSHPVRPTRPFCVGIFGGIVREPEHLMRSSDGELFNLYCAKLLHEDGRTRCAKWDPNRPFNGKSLSVMRHPACEVWARNEKPICSETGKFPELPLCSSIKQNWSKAPAFSCVAENPEFKKFGCGGLGGPAFSDEYPPQSSKDVEYISEGKVILPVGTGSLKESIVHSIFCELWE